MAGQIIKRSEKIYLVRIFMGKDQRTGKRRYINKTIHGTKNIPGMMPTSSTWMFANDEFQLLSFLAKDGKIVLDRTDPIIESTLTTIDKQIVHRGAREAMGL